MKLLQYLVFSLVVLVTANGCLNALDKEIQNNNAQQRAWAMEVSDD